MKSYLKSKSQLCGLALIALITLTSVPAQTPQTAQTGPAGQSLQGVELKGKVPVYREVLKIKLPQAKDTTPHDRLPLLTGASPPRSGDT